MPKNEVRTFSAVIVQFLDVFVFLKIRELKNYHLHMALRTIVQQIFASIFSTEVDPKSTQLFSFVDDRVVVRPSGFG